MEVYSADENREYDQTAIFQSIGSIHSDGKFQRKEVLECRSTVFVDGCMRHKTNPSCADRFQAKSTSRSSQSMIQHFLRKISQPR